MISPSVFIPGLCWISLYLTGNLNHFTKMYIKNSVWCSLKKFPLFGSTSLTWQSFVSSLKVLQTFLPSLLKKSGVTLSLQSVCGSTASVLRVCGPAFVCQSVHGSCSQGLLQNDIKRNSAKTETNKNIIYKPQIM